jgi:hypothetical protein
MPAMEVFAAPPVVARPRRLALLLLAGSIAGLAGCGGGGGGVTSATLSADAAPLVTAQVLETIQLNADLGITGGGVAAQSASGDGGQAQALRQLTRRSIAAAPRAAIDPITFECDVSGTVRYSGNVTGPDTLSPGDVLSASFTGCDDGFGEIINGALRLTVLEFAGDLSGDAYLLRADALFGDLSLTTQEEVFRWNGTARIELDTRVSPITAAVSGAQLDLGIGTAARRLTDYAIDLSVDVADDPPVRRVSGTGSFRSSDLTGFVDFVTVFPFVAEGSANPGSGELLIFGANDASIRVVVVDDSAVQLLLDLDGDDVVEETIDTTWNALNGLAPGAGLVVFCPGCGQPPPECCSQPPPG